MHVPSFKSQPSLSGLKNVCVRSLPSSSGILKGSFLMLSYRFCRRGETQIKGKQRGEMAAAAVICSSLPTHPHHSPILTLRSSSGRSPPSLMPLFMEINRSTGGLSLTLGLCRLVFSMMIANDST